MGCAASCGPTGSTTVRQIKITEAGVEEIPKQKTSTPINPKRRARPSSKVSTGDENVSLLRSKASTTPSSSGSPRKKNKKGSKSNPSERSEINSAFEYETQEPVVPNGHVSQTGSGRRMAFVDINPVNVEDDISVKSYNSGTGITAVQPTPKQVEPRALADEPRSESFLSIRKDEEIRRWMSMTSHSSTATNSCSSKMSDVEVVSKPESRASTEHKVKLTTGSMLSSLSGTSWRSRQRRALYETERNSSGNGSLLILPPRHSRGKPKSSSTNGTRPSIGREKSVTTSWFRLVTESDRDKHQKESSPLSKDSQYHSFEDIDESCELVGVDSDSDVTESHSATLPGYMSSQQSISDSSPRSDNTITQWSQWSDDNPGTNISEDYSPSVNSLETLDAILNRKSRPRAAVGKRPPKYPRSVASKEQITVDGRR